YFLNDYYKKRSAKIFGMEKNVVIENPLLRSGLLFTGSNQTLKGLTPGHHQDDGILTAYEAMNMDLHSTDLVVLSACETALGEEMNGEGVLGLQRSFQIAGAKNIIMSLWAVSDEGTQKLMSLFYKKLVEINDIPEAFRQAQLELKKQYPSPFFWGAFILLQSK
ncbi:MAG TPA: CHAT domain-containing protein, partial [Cytophagaceae bacterium]